MSYSVTGTPVPLTTIFTTPHGCFATVPETFISCIPGAPGATCFWDLGSNCFPPGGVTSFVDEEHTVARVYSPGVLPSGIVPVTTNVDGGTTRVTGCLSGWQNAGSAVVGCMSTLTGAYITLGASGSASLIELRYGYGRLTAVAAQIEVAWQQKDLPILKPTTGGGAGGSSPTRLQATSNTATNTADLSTITKTPKSTGSTHKTTGGASGLSTGAKAGIGIGVVIAVLALAFIGYFVHRHRRATKGTTMQRADSKRPYLDSKAELDNTVTDRQIQEIAQRDPSQPPPIPFASKPHISMMSELEGGFIGHEADHASEQQDVPLHTD